VGINSLINNIPVPEQYSDLWKKIPDEVKELLWFTNEQPDAANHIRGPVITISFNGSEFGTKYNDHALNDPSTIYFRLPLQIPQDISLVNKLPYMPSYAGMNPEQRYVYLGWLQDISREIDVGYRFLFYYGLERQLIIGDFDKTFDMILRLRSTTQNNSFLGYSGNALFYSVVRKGDGDLLDRLRFFYEDEIWTDKQIMLKLFIQEPIEPQELPKILKALSINKRYLDEKVYSEQMSQLLSERFGHSFISTQDIFDDENRSNYAAQDVPVFANYSFPSDVRVMRKLMLPVLDGPISTFTELHNQCHERTKKRLAELRKK
jgi:hypothetical protein